MKIDLNKEAHKKLFEYAENVGLTCEELIRGFIADLTGTNGTNGSDERESAYKWYERAYRPEYNIYHAINGNMWDMDTLIDTIEERQEYINELPDYQDGKHEDERKACIFEIESRSEELEELERAYYENDGGEDFRADLHRLIERYKAI